MAKKLTTDDPTVALVDTFETGDAAYIAHALGIVARTKGIGHETC